MRRRLESLGASVQLRTRENQLFITDNQNYILDCHFPDGIADPASLQTQIRAILGVVDHGLFLGIAQQAIVADHDGLRTLG